MTTMTGPTRGATPEPGDGAEDTPIFGPGSPLANVLALIRRVARTDCNVLITGESGTGKEVVVRALHRWSQRKKGPFVPVNCGAIPENLLESELFGHTKGAFTGADRTRPGRFELAHHGTIFLDEIGDLPLLLQVKLLRVIQERRIEPLGATAARDVDFRLVAATNAPLEDAVRKGAFREDLYFRLNVLRVHLPALRERPMDVPPLVAHFVAMYNHRLLTEVRGFSDSALKLLSHQPWRGNVRELENFVQGLMVLVGEGWVTDQDVRARLSERDTMGFGGAPGSGTGAPGLGAGGAVMSLADDDFPEEGVDLVRRLEAYENRLVDEAMRRADGNKSKAARLLNLNRTTLVEKLKRRGLLDGSGD